MRVKNKKNEVNPKGLSKLISSEKTEILSNWIKLIQAQGGSYSNVSKSELHDLCSEFLSAFIEILEKNNFLKLRMFLEKLSQLRSSQGFRLSEVQRAYYSFYESVRPMIEQWQKKARVPEGSIERVSSIMIDTLFELSEAYYKRLNEKIDGYVDEVEHANLKLKETSIRDGLTGCYNHRYFLDTLDLEISRAKRYKRPFSIAIFDVDHFKNFNDNFGHPFGDEVLKGIGKILQESLRSSDSVFRYGGEEFSIIFPETKRREALLISDRIRVKIANNLFRIKRKKVNVTISGGVGELNEQHPDRETLISNADKALYLAKRHGRNEVTVYKKR
ncbi:MAG: diguanylate cyclase [Candidatus Omnitrophica bacterium]|nr:diguanylate cyclase [Candidatus Omnitrophota bacterium]